MRGRETRSRKQGRKSGKTEVTVVKVLERIDHSRMVKNERNELMANDHRMKDCESRTVLDSQSKVHELWCVWLREAEKDSWTQMT